MKILAHCRTAAAHAESLLAQLGITSLPVAPFDIAKRHDIVVEPKPISSPGISGIIVKVDDTFGIMYATHIKNEGFIRFTVAHELGHYFLPGHPQKLFPDGDGTHASQSRFVSGEQIEQKADHFAASLLMPEGMFVTASKDAGEGFAAIECLATQCKTSITATAIRYATYAESAVAVIVSSGRNIDCCFMSSPIRDLAGISWIRKGDLVPPATATDAFNRDSSNIKKSESAQAWMTLDLWFDGAPNVDMKEDVVGLGSYEKTLTVLFTDEPLSDDDDEY